MATTTNNWQTPGASNPGRYSPGLGGVRTAGLSSSAGLQDYKIEDFAPCPDGTFLGVEGKLGNTDM